jgi:hypothetical protein
MAFLDSTLVKPGAMLQSGTPGYADTVVQNTARSLKRPYQAALTQVRQNMANRGMMEGGLAGQAEGDLNQSYLDTLASAGEKAALKGADLAEQQRQRQQERDWNVQDLNRRYDELDKERKMQQDAADQNKWSSLLTTLGGAAGSAVLGPLGGVAGKKLTDLFSGPDPSDPNYTDKVAPYA